MNDLILGYVATTPAPASAAALGAAVERKREVSTLTSSLSLEELEKAYIEKVPQKIQQHN
jgi:hypothetical protein